MGRIVRPEKCSKCGISHQQIYGHHHLGYDKPLDVIWLCRLCHDSIHRWPKADALIAELAREK